MYLIQILPDKEQCEILIKALKMYGESLDNEGDYEGSLQVDTVRLEIMLKYRKAMSSQRGKP